MCSVAEGDVVQPVKPDLQLISKVCMKCKSNTPVVVIRAVDPLCRPCFLAYCTHKFRLSFGKNRLIRDGEKAMVAFSGGINSTALIHLVLEGKSSRANKKLRFIPSLLYIDEGAVLNQTSEERMCNTKKVVEVMEETKLPYHIYTLEQAVEMTSDSEQNMCDSSAASALSSVIESSTDCLTSHLHQLTLNKDSCQQLHHLFSSCKTLDAKEILLYTLRNRLMIHAAKETGNSKVLIGDSATRLAIRILSNITQGRGAHLAMQVNFGDTRFGDVTLIRPMREFVAKEIAMYNQINNLQSVVHENLATKVKSNASLERLTEQFVAGLQADYPNTVPTIFRTGGKMDMSQYETLEKEDYCVMCKAPIDTDVSEASALKATEFSKSLSNTYKTKTASQAKTDQKSIPATAEHACCDTQQTSKGSSLMRSDLNEVLCYGCRLVVGEMNDIKHLPNVILDEASASARRNQMKASIQQFLLEDQDEG